MVGGGSGGAGCVMSVGGRCGGGNVKRCMYVCMYVLYAWLDVDISTDLRN